MSKPTKASDGRPASRPHVTRAQAAADALASVRAEGLDPSEAEPLLAAWSRGELTNEQLDELSRRLLRDRRLTAKELLDSTRAA
jgi:Antitoxin VbhA